ncbi:MAG: c-type cytochrome [Verrucomicrobiota bacterium]|nr:c-type cytochrome [Verrucomicrobiota bacterium]
MLIDIHAPLRRLLISLFLPLCATLALLAQNGDKPGEIQEPPPAAIKIPPAPPLSPEEALKSFTLPEGFSIEIVASEPLIEAPVAMSFDPQGRIWVVEMRGFMPNVDGLGEENPIGRVSVLLDEDGDGRVEKSTVFADGLVMPRAIALVSGGCLIAEPPNLWFFKDSNGDLKSDGKLLLSTNYGSQVNPEHTSNGLLWGLDNWIYSANHTSRHRFINGNLKEEPTIFRGQWGITQDDHGRLFYNSNSDQLRGDLLPAEYLLRNPGYKSFGGNVQLVKDQAVWPIRVNPGVNRGYQKGQLREDGTLATFTGACGPCVYRGDNFPDEYYGTVFLCEPTANVVRCNKLIEKEGILSAVNLFDKREFLASTDERFRPVNLFNGPDGALYIVDMYRGVLQHRIYLTTYLRKQALERGLDKPLNLGRIYRVISKAKPRSKITLTTEEDRVNALGATNGWARDTAQRLLVESKNSGLKKKLEKIVTDRESPAALHALWVLEGRGELNQSLLLNLLTARDAKVRKSAVRLLENALGKDPDHILPNLLTLENDPDFHLRLQLALTLGEVNTRPAYEALARLLEKNGANPLFRDAVISGVNNKELLLLDALFRLPEWNVASPARSEIITALSRSATSDLTESSTAGILELAASQLAGTVLDSSNTVQKNVWRSTALLSGLASHLPPVQKEKPEPKIKTVLFQHAPSALLKLQPHTEPELFAKVESLLSWPGKPGETKTVKPVELTADEQKLFTAGKELYTFTCGACHQPHGQGQEGLAPPLADSEWTTGSPERLVRIVLHGVRGPMTVRGKVYEMEMPPLNVLEDEQIASLLTYIRREWGHTASPVSVDFVKKIRDSTAQREEAWTEAELNKLK